MKNLLFTIIAVVSITNIKAQDATKLFDNNVNVTILQTIINELNSILIVNKDALIQKNEVAEKYKSNFCLNNNSECTVTNYTNKRSRGNYGSIVWQSKIKTQYDFETAKLEYQKLFTTLNNASFVYNSVLYKLNTSYIEPTVQVNYATSLFEFGKNKRMNIYLQLLKVANNWTIQIDVFEVNKITD